MKKAFCIYCLLAFCLSPSHFVLALDMRAEQKHILEQARALPLKLQSCEFEYVGSQTEKRKLCIDGGRWSVAVLGDDGEPKYSEGFDGTKYHSMRRNESGLAIYGSEPLGSHKQLETHPLVTPYTWLTAEKLGWDDVKSAAVWDAAISKMTYIGPERVDEHDCETFALTHGDVNYQVSFAKNLGGFPVKMVVSKNNNRPSGTMFVAGTWSEPGGPVVATLFESAPNGSPRRKGTYIVDGSLRVNQHIDDISFAFDPAGAEIVIDADKRLRP